MKAYERLIGYSAFPTASDGGNPTCPSTPSQLEFARALADELTALGLSGVTLDENGYLFAYIPPTPGCEAAPAIGFLAHLDVVSDVEYRSVKPRVIAYEGGDITLNAEKDIVMRVADFPFLADYVGRHLVVTDGNTLLGADDKAGIAEIVTMCESMLNDKTIRHGKICVGFTPDEEIGRGPDHFSVERFGAKYAYTCDGGAFGEVEYETFNAASLNVTIHGINIHPGEAKNRMVNASLVAAEFIAMLPELERPEHTELYEGFYHLTAMEGTVENARLRFILRDHDAAKLEGRKDYVRRVAEELNRRYGGGTVTIEIRDTYRNLREAIEPHFHLVENAYKAVREQGGTPVSPPVRGGTDGSRLSFMGLPCPNLGTGSHNHHGRTEFACVEAMDDCVEVLLKLASYYAQA